MKILYIMMKTYSKGWQPISLASFSGTVGWNPSRYRGLEFFRVPGVGILPGTVGSNPSITFWEAIKNKFLTLKDFFCLSNCYMSITNKHRNWKGTFLALIAKLVNKKVSITNRTPTSDIYFLIVHKLQLTKKTCRLQALEYVSKHAFQKFFPVPWVLHPHDHRDNKEQHVRNFPQITTRIVAD